MGSIYIPNLEVFKLLSEYKFEKNVEVIEYILWKLVNNNR